MCASNLPYVYRRLQISPAESLILEEIANVATPQGQNARISYGALAARTGYSLRWVKELVKRLLAKHLLRVWVRIRRRGHNFINIYTLVRVWLRDTAQKRSAGSVHPNTNTKRNRDFASHEECLRLGLTPGSVLYNAARGLQDGTKPEHEAVS